MMGWQTPFRIQGCSPERGLWRSTARWLLAALALAHLPSASSLAGVIRHDTNDSLYLALAAGGQFAATGELSGGVYCSATLIHPEWVLTAAHCLNVNVNPSIYSFSVGGVAATADSVHVPAGWNGSVAHGYDIGLVHLSMPIMSVAPAQIYRGASELNSVATMVGYGWTGTGQTGQSVHTNVRRAGTNAVDAYLAFTETSYFLTMTDFAGVSTGLVWDFDSPASDPQHGATDWLGLQGFGTAPTGEPLQLEYQLGFGDSGGASYIFEDGQWYVAGVHSAAGDTFAYPGAADQLSTYGDISLATRVSSYQSFIDGLVPVPEPSGLLLAFAGLAVAAGCLRRRLTARGDGGIERGSSSRDSSRRLLRRWSLNPTRRG